MADKEDEGGYGTNPGASTFIPGSATLAWEAKTVSQNGNDDDAPAICCSEHVAPTNCALAAAQPANKNEDDNPLNYAGK
ncbi:hypothetical protein H1R20_g13826, partial [Candolleomyces eurysporus]